MQTSGCFCFDSPSDKLSTNRTFPHGGGTVLTAGQVTTRQEDNGHFLLHTDRSPEQSRKEEEERFTQHNSNVLNYPIFNFIQNYANGEKSLSDAHFIFEQGNEIPRDN